MFSLLTRLSVRLNKTEKKSVIFEIVLTLICQGFSCPPRQSKETYFLFHSCDLVPPLVVQRTLNFSADKSN